MNTTIEYTTANLKFFNYQHLPPHLQDVSKPFAELAYTMTTILPDCEERTVMIRKLLEAKDCAIRLALSRSVV